MEESKNSEDSRVKIVRWRKCRSEWALLTNQRKKGITVFIRFRTDHIFPGKLKPGTLLEGSSIKLLHMSYGY